MSVSPLRRSAAGFALLAVLAAPAGFARAEEPVGTVRFQERTVAAGIGYSWGAGELTFEGRKHPFKVNGLSAGQAGAEDVTASGKVYRLKKLSDFNGNYTAASADVAVGGGEGGALLQNQNGVVMRVHSTSQGVNFQFGPEGVKVTLE
jgi:hypothetical protein